MYNFQSGFRPNHSTNFRLAHLADKIKAPIKERSTKHNSQEWFDGEISKAIKNCDKLLKKFKRSRLHINKELYNVARCKVHQMIFNKKKYYFESKLNECIGKPKELWKALRIQ